MDQIMIWTSMTWSKYFINNNISFHCERSIGTCQNSRRFPFSFLLNWIIISKLIDSGLDFRFNDFLVVRIKNINYCILLSSTFLTLYSQPGYIDHFHRIQFITSFNENSITNWQFIYKSEGNIVMHLKYKEILFRTMAFDDHCHGIFGCLSDF